MKQSGFIVCPSCKSLNWEMKGEFPFIDGKHKCLDCGKTWVEDDD